MVTSLPPWKAHSTYHPCCEEIPPDVQPELHLEQLKTMSWCSVIGCLEGEADSHLATISFQGVLESDKIIPDPLLQAKRRRENLGGQE